METPENEVGKHAPIYKNDKLYDGPTSYFLISSGHWLWWARPHVTRYLWHSSCHYLGPRTWEDLISGDYGKVYVVFRNHNPHYTRLPLIEPDGTIRVIEES